MAVRTSEVNVQWVLYNRRTDFKFKYGEVKLQVSIENFHLMVARCVHFSRTISADDTDLEM